MYIAGVCEILLAFGKEYSVLMCVRVTASTSRKGSSGMAAVHYLCGWTFRIFGYNFHSPLCSTNLNIGVFAFGEPLIWIPWRCVLSVIDQVGIFWCLYKLSRFSLDSSVFYECYLAVSRMHCGSEVFYRS